MRTSGIIGTALGCFAAGVLGLLWLFVHLLLFVVFGLLAGMANMMSVTGTGLVEFLYWFTVEWWSMAGSLVIQSGLVVAVLGLCLVIFGAGGGAVLGWLRDRKAESVPP